MSLKNIFSLKTFFFYLGCFSLNMADNSKYYLQKQNDIANQIKNDDTKQKDCIYVFNLLKKTLAAKIYSYLYSETDNTITNSNIKIKFNTLKNLDPKEEAEDFKNKIQDCVDYIINNMSSLGSSFLSTDNLNNQKNIQKKIQEIIKEKTLTFSEKGVFLIQPKDLTQSNNYSILINYMNYYTNLKEFLKIINNKNNGKFHEFFSYIKTYQDFLEKISTIKGEDIKKIKKALSKKKIKENMFENFLSMAQDLEILMDNLSQNQSKMIPKAIDSLKKITVDKIQNRIINTKNNLVYSGQNQNIEEKINLYTIGKWCLVTIGGSIIIKIFFFDMSSSKKLQYSPQDIEARIRQEQRIMIKKIQNLKKLENYDKKNSKFKKIR